MRLQDHQMYSEFHVRIPLQPVIFIQADVLYNDGGAGAVVNNLDKNII